MTREAESLLMNVAMWCCLFVVGIVIGFIVGRSF